MPPSSYLSQAEQGLSRFIMTTKQTHKKYLRQYLHADHTTILEKKNSFDIFYTHVNPFVVVSTHFFA